MARPAGRDQAVALRRLVRILTLLANAAPAWVNRDQIIEAVGYSSPELKDRRDLLRRDLRNLKDLGWCIESDSGEGAQARLRLLDQDPRLATMLTGPQRQALARAVWIAGANPADLGLAELPTDAQEIPVSLPASDMRTLEGALHALQHRCLVHAVYHGKPRELHVDRVFQTATGRWRIVARECGEQKQFRLDRFESMTLDRPGSASATEPDHTSPDPLTYADGEPMTAVVRIPRDHERHAVRELGAPTRRTVDGDVIEVDIPVTNHALWRARLYQLGERVQLVGPPALRDEVREELLAFLARSGP